MSSSFLSTVNQLILYNKTLSVRYFLQTMDKCVVFFDCEFAKADQRLYDAGAISTDGAVFHGAEVSKFRDFLERADILCGHNILAHDLKLLKSLFSSSLSSLFQKILVKPFGHKKTPLKIDTLYLSALLFPKKPYHRLVKDEKLITEELCNPVNDAQKCQTLFLESVETFRALPAFMQVIFYGLLNKQEAFEGFFDYLGYHTDFQNLAPFIKDHFEGKICSHADIETLVKERPLELAFCLSLINTDDKTSIFPAWVLKNFPSVEAIFKQLRFTPCAQGCSYCRTHLNVRQALKRFFGFDEFRTYNGEPLQEKAADAAVHAESLLAIFPTGGGKSLTFQLPALMAGDACHGLTVVLSPLQSLMKDQVDHLVAAGISDAVTINGLLDPIERAQNFDQIYNGNASLLYVSPEQLRSRTLEKALLSRHIERFVIDEAHCFSAWGHDFRVDYLYIGDFIRELQEKKGGIRIPVSCFTATAKQKVVQDIRDYFKEKLDLDLKLYVSQAARENLHYSVWHVEDDDKKYAKLRELIEQKSCPTIVYVSRVDATEELAQRLNKDGFSALPYNGKMASEDKTKNQEAFLSDQVRIMVATNAFGMGVDKKDVGLVIHYDISSSLENYVQEAGRAGRDPALSAECHILFNENDLNKHFLLLNQTKLSMSEIQQVWKAIKDHTKRGPRLTCSALELARWAGWDRESHELETGIKTALATLELAGYIKRGQNVPHIYATSLKVASVIEANSKIDACPLFTNDTDRQVAKRIIGSLISSHSIAQAGNDEAESRVDYLADRLGIEKGEIIRIISLLKEGDLLRDDMDMSAYIFKSDTEKKSFNVLRNFTALEQFLITELSPFTDERIHNLKELNAKAQEAGLSSSIKKIRTIFYYWKIKSFFEKITNCGNNHIKFTTNEKTNRLADACLARAMLCDFILKELFERASEQKSEKDQHDRLAVNFSVISLQKKYCQTSGLFENKATQKAVEDALLYLSKIDALRIEGGFLVLYNGLSITRLELSNLRKYKRSDYQQLDDYYEQKIQQIHIVGQFANLMLKNYDAALQYVHDYFYVDYRDFINKYFKDNKADLSRTITKKLYQKLFGSLSEKQLAIINDHTSQHIVVAAGPGSGKTRVLVHKLAALLLMEDVKRDQLLMLTFSRAAATEFKQRLIDLTHSAAFYVEVKTFHSYCFDLLGRPGTLNEADNVVKKAAEMIREGDVEQDKITKSVLVIDEAQDMSEDDFALVEALMQRNETMRVIAVGDDDQNIYAFRGSDSKFMRELLSKYDAMQYELTENFRSARHIVDFSNAYASSITTRMKTKPAVAHRDVSGQVTLIHHHGHHFEKAIIDELSESKETKDCAVLTSTNEEAALIFNALQKAGLNAKLIQSRGDIHLYNLLEIRSFLVYLQKRLQGDPIVSRRLWNFAKVALQSRFHQSRLLPNCLRLIQLFESVTPREIYFSDFEEFVRESQLEDTFDNDQGKIFVSTIHKAKGHEFGTVHMFLDNVVDDTDEERRKLYVGMTRAKNSLYIHHSGTLFGSIKTESLNRIEDRKHYDKPSEIVLNLTLADVNLGFVSGKKEELCQLRSGQILFLKNKLFTTKLNGQICACAFLSKAFQEKLLRYRQMGYFPNRAEINFIVAWNNKETGETEAIVLPNLYLSQKENRPLRKRPAKLNR